MSVLAAQCLDKNVTVIVSDLNQQLIDAWNSEDLPIYEPGLYEVVKRCRGKNLFFTTEIESNIEKCDIIFVSVNTPTKTSGMGAGRAANIKNCELAARMVANIATTPKIVVEKSTVPVRTAESMGRVLAANARGLKHQILSNPEFLAEGTAVKDLEEPSRVLIGGEQTKEGLAAIEKLAAVYAHWVPRDRIICTNLWSSELSKLVANAFLAQRISSINSISALCEVSGADITEVSRSVGMDPRVGSKFLNASVGFGGSCFQKDILNLVYLCESFGLNEVAKYWQSVIDMNEYQKSRFVKNMVRTMFNTITGKKVTLLGFAFKKDTGDCRETAAAYITRYLIEEQSKISVFDPKVKYADLVKEMEYTCQVKPETVAAFVTLESDVYKSLEQSHCLAVVTEWDMFAKLDFQRVYDSMAKPAFVFDGRNILPHAKLREIGFEVYAIGQPTEAAASLFGQFGAENGPQTKRAKQGE